MIQSFSSVPSEQGCEITFSVVVPLYNKAAHVVRTLGSALAQSHPPLEIIVIDDGSTDAGPELVMALADPRVKLVRQANGGVARARNNGITQARGQWVAFLDADDWYHPEHLRSLAREISCNPDADTVASGYMSVQEAAMPGIAAWPLPPEAPSERITDLPARWLLGATFFTSSVAVRTSRLQALQPCFPPGESNGEDLDLWFRLAELTPVVLNTTPLVARVWTPDGLSVQHKSLLEPPYVQRMVARAQAGQVPPHLVASIQRLVCHNRLTAARTAMSGGDRRLAWRLLWQSRAAVGQVRWWTTLLMNALVPGHLVDKWQTWRKRRRMVLG